MSASGNSFTRNMLTLLGGTAVAQAIPLLFTPLLTRLYTPEAFGMLAVLLAVVNPIGLLASGRYELTVPLPKEDGAARALVRVGLLVATCVFPIALLAAYLVSQYMDASADPSLLRNVLPYAPLLLFAMALFQPLNHWLIRREAFTAMSRNKVVQMATISFGSALLGWLAWPHGLLIGYLLGWMVNVLVAYYQAQRAGFHLLPLEAPVMRTEAIRYRAFPLVNALPAVLHTAALSVPVFTLTALAGDAITGQFNLSRQVVFLPSSFIAVAFAQVYMQRASRSASIGVPVLPDLMRALRSLSAIAALLAGVLLLAGPELFAFFFGSAWAEAGRFARILALPIALQFVVIPLAVVLPALGHIKRYSIWQGAYFFLVLLYSLLHPAIASTYLLGLSLIEVSCYGILLWLIVRAAHRHDASLKPASDG
ncbi:MAG: oligosaccharide flippase family protein [Flavobacteriales bacterium]|nr:oligosaccharide flippase family protein [Flavobacteriales bacterium]